MQSMDASEGSSMTEPTNHIYHFRVGKKKELMLF